MGAAKLSPVHLPFFTCPLPLTGQEVVVMGTGAFALEAAEAAARRGAKHVTLISRPRSRWVLPLPSPLTGQREKPLLV